MTITHNTVLYVKEFKKVDPVFFYYLLKTLDFSQLNSGSAVPSLNRNFIHPFKVTVPEDLPTQTAIAEILSSLDDKIELNNKINQELENLAQTLFKQWFIDFEFPVSLNHDSLDLHDEQDLKINTKEKNQINYKNQGNQANPKNQGSDTYRSSGGEMVESELGEIPKGWELVRLGDKYTVSDFVANGSFTSLKENVTILETPSFAIFLRNTDSKSNFTNQLRYVDEKTYNFLSKSRIIGNEICISNVADVGTVFRPPLYLKKPLTLGNNLVFFRSDHPNYFYLYFKYFQGQDQIQSITSGSAQLKFNKTDFRNLNLLDIPKAVLSTFEDRINDLWELQSNLLSENIELTTLRDTLLPKLISGELEVNGLNRDFLDLLDEKDFKKNAKINQGSDNNQGNQDNPKNQG